MRKNKITRAAFDPCVVLRLPHEVELRCPNVVLGMRLHPGVVEARVVRNKIKHQLQTAIT
jgi:hypothetical protein